MNSASLFLSAVLAVATALSGCHRKDADPIPPAPAAPSQPATPTLSRKEQACVSMREIYKTTDGTLPPIISQPAKEYAVERHYQRVIRKSCDGSTVSDRIETVRSPLVDISLNAPREVTNFQSVFVFNETTCDHKLTQMPVINIPKFLLLGFLYNVTGNGKDRIVLSGDLANAMLTFHLAPGENRIFVDYHIDCSPKNTVGNINGRIGEATCETSKQFVRAFYPVKVLYSEKTLQGSTTIEPSVEECQNKKK